LMRTTFVMSCAVLVLSTFSNAQSPTLNALPNTVYVGADGKFETAPDTALIQFNISAQAESAKEAYEQAAKQAETTRQVMRANGIDPKSARKAACGGWLARARFTSVIFWDNPG